MPLSTISDAVSSVGDEVSSAWDSTVDQVRSARDSIRDTWNDYEEVRYATIGAVAGAGLGAAAAGAGLTSASAGAAATAGAVSGGLSGAATGYQERKQREAMENAEVGDTPGPARRAPSPSSPDKAAQAPRRDGGRTKGAARGARTGDGIGSPLNIPR